MTDEPDTAMAGRQQPDITGHWRSAALFVAPFLILMLAWALSNPPGAAPDEPDHLVKAIGMARFDIGTKYEGPPVGDGGLGQQRNASISRVITIPANLAPDGYLCEIFQPTVTAACLPTNSSTSTAPKGVIVPLGSYPPFLYVPIGWVAVLASSPAQAFLLTRIFCALLCSVLLLLGAAHLTRALGRRALLGAFVGLTPMVVFCGSAVTTSGLEICAAFAVSCVVVVGIRRPASLTEAGTQLLLAGVGSTLMLSRQLGVVTFGLMMVLLLIRVGPRLFGQLFAARRPAFLSSVSVLLLAGIAVVVWESVFDHPSMIGSVFNASALGSFGLQSYGVLRSGVAQFGWLDTLVPPWMLAAWIVLCVVLIGIGGLIGRRADRLTLMVWTLVMVVIAYVTYATVFFPLDASLQGRHLLAVFILLPVLAGVMIIEQVGSLGQATIVRLFRLVAIIMPVLQGISLYLNARRYAVGTRGPVWIFGLSQWKPQLGWSPMLVLGLIGTVGLGFVIIAAARSTPIPTGTATATEGHSRVER